MSDRAVFGTRVPGALYKDRPSVYALIRRPNELAVVRIGRRLHLPGGGIEAGETELEALARELREEIDAELVRAEKITIVEQLYWSSHYQVHYRNIGVFFRAEVRLPDQPTLIDEHELTWLTLAQATTDLTQEFQRHVVALEMRTP